MPVPRPPYASLIGLFLLCGLSACEKEVAQTARILPVGRAFAQGSGLEFRLNGSLQQAPLTEDDCDGSWMVFGVDALVPGDSLEVAFTLRSTAAAAYPGEGLPDARWTDPSHFIDSDRDEIRTTAREVCEGLENDLDKIQALQRYTYHHLTFHEYRRSFGDKASASLEMGYGTCMNFSRVFVALCRAAGIPARSVWGIVYDYHDNGIYDYHHQWAEALDGEGFWHPMDFTYSRDFDLVDLRYLDLIHGAEENPFWEETGGDLLLPDVTLLHHYPVSTTARLGFELDRDDRPDSMRVVFRYVLE
ncbi:MAG: transglutaminase-like domain-containing protein [Bacteroidales bacterium]